MTSPRRTEGTSPGRRLTISLQLGEDFLRQVVSIGGVQAWNDLQRRLGSVVGQIWSPDEDVPAINVSFVMSKRVKADHADADFRHVWFEDEAEDERDLPRNIRITILPTYAEPVKDAIVELLFDA